MTPFSAREKVLLACTLILAAILFFGKAGGLTTVAAREGNDRDIFKELKTFTDVLAIVRRDYVTPIDNKKLIEGAIKGMLGALDPHSGYLDPEFYSDLQVQTKGEFGGLGIEITVRDGLLVVVAPMEDSPAAKAGVRAGDAIVKIEGKYTKDFTLVDAVKRLRGPKGTPITISVAREGRRQPLDITIVRDNVTVRSVKARALEDGYVYVRLSQFMERTASDLKKALEILQKRVPGGEIKGLLLDLRNNPGGLLTQAVRVSDMFLTEGVIVYTEGRVEAQKQKFFAHTRGTEPRYPIVVLVNGGSASASEIVAGAFKDHGRALIVGSQTFGKGSVQTVTPLKYGGAITLTTALYYTKSGRSIQVSGVTPDVEVEAERMSKKPEVEEESNGVDWKLREGDLPGAIENPSEKKRKDRGALHKINKTPILGTADRPIDIETVELKEWIEADEQFARSYELLKDFNIFKNTANEERTAELSASPRLRRTSQLGE